MNVRNIAVFFNLTLTLTFNLRKVEKQKRQIQMKCYFYNWYLIWTRFQNLITF